ncbi:Kinase-like protein [Mycena kentingensis (nom. inval.)]|nr:Kinase-like protein [Mycena kentingensis (nom. inval.)]
MSSLPDLPVCDWPELLYTNAAPLDAQLLQIRAAVSSAQATRAIVAQHVSTLEAALAMAYARLDDIDTFIVTHQSLLSPIRRVPDDVLAEIFRLVVTPTVPKHVAPLCKLSSVCQSWRRVGQAMRLLWANIVVPHQDWQRGDSAARECGRIGMQLANSGSVLLTLDVDLRSVAIAAPAGLWPFNELDATASVPALDLLLQHSERWEYGDHGIRIGDVGRVTATGAWQFFFNIYLPADHPIHAQGVSAGFEPLPAFAPYDLHRENNLSAQGLPPISYSSTNARRRSDLEFTCRGPAGALVILPDGSCVEELKTVDALRAYAHANAAGWFHHLHALHGIPLHEDLYLVTGHEKAYSGGLAVFHNIPSTDVFQIGLYPLLGEPAMRHHVFHATRSDRVHTRTFPSSRIHRLNNTIFIRGFALSLESGPCSLSSKVILTRVAGSPPELSIQSRDVQPVAKPLKMAASIRRSYEQLIEPLCNSDSSASFTTIVLQSWEARQKLLEILDGGLLEAEIPSARRLLVKLAQTSKLFPASLFITRATGRSPNPVAFGGFADVYTGTFKAVKVAVKHTKYFTLDGANDGTKKNQQLFREALVWKNLRHRYILPFFGIDCGSFPNSIALVSPWMEFGTARAFLEQHSAAHRDRLLEQVLEGLEYLHSTAIVHGDLHGGNVLVDAYWNVQLTDFGLATFIDSLDATPSSQFRGGNPHWLAPELHSSQRYHRTPATDIFAFACLCIEFYTGREPFGKIGEMAAMYRFLNGDRPPRPMDMGNMLWSLVTECWEQQAARRPSTSVALTRFRLLIQGVQNRRLEATPVQRILSSLPVPGNHKYVMKQILEHSSAVHNRNRERKVEKRIGNSAREYVGVAIRESGLARSEFYVTTKYSTYSPPPLGPRDALEKTQLNATRLRCAAAHNFDQSCQCAVQHADPPSHRNIAAFNANGWYAMERTERFVKVWL